jgi:hypothetical protein
VKDQYKPVLRLAVVLPARYCGCDYYSFGNQRVANQELGEV